MPESLRDEVGTDRDEVGTEGYTMKVETRKESYASHFPFHTCLPSPHKCLTNDGLGEKKMNVASGCSADTV